MMNPRHLLTALLAGLAAVLPPGTAGAAVRVVTAEEVRNEYIHTSNGVTYLTVHGRQWDLVTDPASPVLSSLGDGSFHPMDTGEVEAALGALGGLVYRFDLDIVILPFPRRATLKSSCEAGAIFLSPGIRPVSPDHVRATVIHELGHHLHRTRAPAGSAAWATYTEIRGLDPVRHHAGAHHRDRPNEIFAEDFRQLLGGPVASAAGQENPDLPAARLVPGLLIYMEELAASPPVAAEEPAEPQTFPNPFSRGSSAGMEIRFQAPEGPADPGWADVYDLRGRHVRSIRGSLAESRTVAFFWDGRGDGGRGSASGFYFVRWRGRPEAGTARVQVLR